MKEAELMVPVKVGEVLRGYVVYFDDRSMNRAGHLNDHECGPVKNVDILLPPFQIPIPGIWCMSY